MSLSYQMPVKYDVVASRSVTSRDYSGTAFQTMYEPNALSASVTLVQRPSELAEAGRRALNIASTMLLAEAVLFKNDRITPSDAAFLRSVSRKRKV
jgi:hypothetical protein